MVDVLTVIVFVLRLIILGIKKSDAINNASVKFGIGKDIIRRFF